jgi:hypothetical protein
MRNRFPRNCRIQLGSLENVVLLTGDRKFESISLQRRVCELSVPLLSRPEGDVRGIGFQTVRTYIAIGNSEARGAMLARTIFGVAENSQAYRGPRARHPPRIEAF